MTPEEVQRRVDQVPYWYHTLELAPGVVTPGHFDLRGVVADLPWPDVRGRRCLDVATFDGFYAFELERRGAAEVVAIDLDDVVDLDWLPREQPRRPARGTEVIGDGFRLAREVLGSGVRRQSCSVYDLAPDDVGEFDVVVCGALLQHLRDPVAALEAMRSVCRGHLLSVERVDVRSSLGPGRRPTALVKTRQRTWELPNVLGHRAWVSAAGFDVSASTVVGVPLGPGEGPEETRDGRRRARRLVQAAGRRVLTGTSDPPFSVVVAHPTPDLSPASGSG